MILIGSIILFLSVITVFVIIWRKVPLLAEYAPMSSDSFRIFDRIRSRVHASGIKRKFAGETLLLKVLSKTRIYILKIEHKIAMWLNSLRQKSIKKNNQPIRSYTEGYWDQVRQRRGRRKTHEEENDDKGFHIGKIE